MYTIYGPVQVQITVRNGKITAAQAVVYPQQTPRDQQINSYAIPALDSEAVAAGSARIDAVSGATYTSDGYIGSLQSALDKAAGQGRRRRARRGEGQRPRVRVWTVLAEMRQEVRVHQDGESMETLAVHGGERRPGPEGSVVFPIYQGTVYSVEPGTDYHDIRYIRLNSTPSQRYLHDKLAALEGAEAAVATASGMAAVTTALLSVLRAGDHLLASDCLYGGTHDFLTGHAADLGWRYDFVDVTRPETWAAARTPQTRAFLVETITNPLMRVGLLDQIADFARREGLVTVIDNTFASPVNFRPLAAGFDLCFHSATKYLGGHSDLVAGCVMGSREAIDRVRRTLNHFGGSLDPHTGFLLARGIKTLALRVRAQNGNALALAGFLAGHPEVAAVNYPGLPSHPDHAHAARLLSGFGGMLSLRLRGGAAAAEALLDALRLPYVAPSLGGVETLITRPAATSHAGMSPQDRERLGITDDLIRVSCGIEGERDLIADFGQALTKVGGAGVSGAGVSGAGVSGAESA